MRRVILPLLGLAATTAFGQPKFSHPDRIRYDGQCFTIDGKDTFLFSGAFHYFRCPRALWKQRFQAIKDAGFNTVETYIAWNWNERDRPSGLNDFSKVDLRDLDDWLTMAEKEFGLYTIVRPGPYICSEWATGGFPNWLATFRPEKAKRTDWFRSDDPAFEAWSRHWFKAVADVVRKHQLTKKPSGSRGVILWQVENEYDFTRMPWDAKRNYVRDLMKATVEDGIDVPIFGCWTSPIRDARGDPVLSQAFDNPNQYPRWSIESVGDAIDDQHRAQPWAPRMVTEFQGGWFGQVGGQSAEEQDGIDHRQIKALTLYAIQRGLTGLNYYMLYGGTNLGDWAAEGITTSYDYYAPIREWGGMGSKYRAVQAVGKMLEQYGTDLTRSTEVTPPTISGSANLRIAARKGTSGATYLFVRNRSRSENASGSIGGVVSVSLGSFGMEVYRYTNDLAQGEWVTTEAAVTPPALPAPIRIHQAEVAGAEPTGWKKAPNRATNADLGVWDSRFLFYRASMSTKATGNLWVRSTGGELVTATPASRTVSGGGLWPLSQTPRVFAFLNPGWPNGGSGMENPRGVLGAKCLPNLPRGTALSDWKGKVLADGNDRSLVGVGVDTAGWVEGVPNDLFRPNTTTVIRATVNLGDNPNANLVLSTEGVDDEGWFYVNGHLVGETHVWGTPAVFPVGMFIHAGSNDVAVVIRNNDGDGGLTGNIVLEAPMPVSLPFDWRWTDRLKTGTYSPYPLDVAAALTRNAHPSLVGTRHLGGSIATRSRVRFPRPGNGPWEIVLEAGGDGFLSLNGQPLGRFWEVGPQRGYYLPESMLRAQNVLELTVIPGRTGDRIRAAELRPLPMIDSQ